MQRLKLFLISLGGLLFMFLVYKTFFTHADTHLPAPDILSSSGATLSSTSSSLNLIVRVSPLLRKQKTASTRSYLSPTQSAPASVPYEFYTSAESIRGKRVVLFFVDMNDPFSIDHHAFITDLFNSGLLRVPTYRVDVETAFGARLAYGVIVSDTFIVLDETGHKVQSIIHPSEAELRALLTSKPR